MISNYPQIDGLSVGGFNLLSKIFNLSFMDEKNETERKYFIKND